MLGFNSELAGTLHRSKDVQIHLAFLVLQASLNIHIFPTFNQIATGGLKETNVLFVTLLESLTVDPILELVVTTEEACIFQQPAQMI